MSAFTAELTLTEYHVAQFLWRVHEPLIYELGELGSGDFIIVPPDYVTDGASIPRLLWAFLPAWGKYSRAAVVHDYLCTLVDRDMPHQYAPTRREADAVFFEAMGVCQVSLIVRWALWIGARIGAIVPGKARNAPYN